MELKVKMLVRVSGAFANGLGWIEDISNSTFYPVQVKLLVPNEDGHSTIRFDYAEVEPVFSIVEPKEEKTLSDKLIERLDFIRNIEEVEPEAEEVELEKPKVHMLVRMTKRINGYSFKEGDVFAASDTSSGYNTCYYLFDPVTFIQRGCMVKEAFELLHENLSAADITRKAQIRQVVTNAVEKPRKAIKKEVDVIAPEAKEKPKKAKKKRYRTVFEALEAKGQMNIFEFEEVK